MHTALRRTIARADKATTPARRPAPTPTSVQRLAARFYSLACSLSCLLALSLPSWCATLFQSSRHLGVDQRCGLGARGWPRIPTTRWRHHRIHFDAAWRMNELSTHSQALRHSDGAPCFCRFSPPNAPSALSGQLAPSGASWLLVALSIAAASIAMGTGRLAKLVTALSLLADPPSLLAPSSHSRLPRCSPYCCLVALALHCVSAVCACPSAFLCLLLLASAGCARSEDARWGLFLDLQARCAATRLHPASAIAAA